MLPYSKSRTPGFTLIEILVVVAIIGILAGIAILIIDPGRQLARSRNARRRVDIHAVSLAVYRYALDTGTLPPDITTTQTEICRQNADCTGLVDLSMLLDREEFLLSIPEDPINTSANGTGYEIIRSEFGSVTVVAALAELGDVISVKR